MITYFLINAMWQSQFGDVQWNFAIFFIKKCQFDSFFSQKSSNWYIFKNPKSNPGTRFFLNKNPKPAFSKPGPGFPSLVKSKWSLTCKIFKILPVPKYNFQIFCQNANMKHAYFEIEVHFFRFNMKHAYDKHECKISNFNIIHVL